MLNDKMKGITKMKKARFLVGAIALAVLAAIIVACTKEKEKKAARNCSEMVTVSKEDDMSAYLKQFKEKMQSASKGGETLSLEDARWHLEAVLNYTYGDARYQTTEIQCDTFYYKLPTDGNGVTLARLNEAFITLSKDVENAYADCNLPEKSVLAIQTVFENESKDDDIVVQTILNVRGFVTIPMWFDSTDYWNEWYHDYGDGYIVAGGKCGPYIGEHPESGAPLELTRKLNLRISGHECFQGSGYFTDTEDIDLSCHGYYYYYPYDNFVYDENSPCHYKIYYRNEDPHEPWASNPGGCICPEDMNYYLSKGPELINHYCPSGKVVISAYYKSDLIVGRGSRDGNCFHELTLKYGVFHCNGAGGGNDY